MKRTASVEDHKLAALYENVRETLRGSKYSERSNKPLAFWALPKDRRLPLALLGYSLKDLLAHSFDELSATAGVGKKKFNSLVKLLHRATNDQIPEATALVDGPAANKTRTRVAKLDPSGFNPALVSELLWEQWRQTVRRCELQQETLGRLCPSLYKLPTVIWRTKLAEYLNLTIHEMRRLKTHGEKRVHGILEVFHGIHETLGHVPQHSHLQVDLRPKFTVAIERWINRILNGSRSPRASELEIHVVGPILEQLRVDAGPTVFQIVQERLGINTVRRSVQQQAKRLRVTRARVYQLLETCGDVLALRWPEGDNLMGRLHQKLSTFPKAKVQIAQLRGVTELIYPSLEQGSAAGNVAP